MHVADATFVHPLVGSSHRESLGNRKTGESAEIITLSLTFDHRAVNSASAASFVHDIKEGIASFDVSASRTAENKSP